MKTSINIDDILFKVLQEKTGESNINQFVADALQQQLGVNKAYYEIETNECQLEDLFEFLK
ncbi:MAG: hypothetical protein QM487_06125 [Candidatus Marithrix sp.]